MQTARLGIDIGGTFTDFVLEHGPRQLCLKLLTTPQAPERAVLDGVARLLRAAELTPDAIGMVVHGTTLATNAMIERRGAKVAFLTTEGFRDTLEMAYEHRYDQYDLLVDKPQPLVPRALRLPVPERIGADGRVRRPLDEAAVRRLAVTITASGAEAVAVGFLHSYVNDAHEVQTARILCEALPTLPMSISSDVSPEMREYERFSTVVANAYVQPLMARYLSGLRDGLARLGVISPLLLMQSNGGLCDIETAVRYPVRLMESGPAGGAIFAAALARELGIAKALLLDIGGTTAKLCFIDDGRAQTARSLEVARIDRFKAGSGLPLRFPVVELCEIGAGGGSIASIDRLGRLKVGPQSAGSEPGPACYARGGHAATLTDAQLVLHRLDPKYFAAGSIALDATAAETAVTADVAQPLGRTPHEAAIGIVEVVNENMANAAREHAIDVGKSTAGRTLIVIGGAAALHAADLAGKLDIDEVVVPNAAGVGSAVGFLRAPLAFEKSRSQHQLLSRFAPEGALSAIARLIQETSAALTHAGETTTPLVSIWAQMRYRGQGSELSAAIDREALASEGAGHLRYAFERAYQHQYGRTIANDVELLGWTVRAELPMTWSLPITSSSPAAALPGSEHMLIEQSSAVPVPARRLARPALREQQTVLGPALIVDAGTTIVMPSNFVAEVLAGGHLRLQTAARWRAARPLAEVAE
jgi:N-methylhydantoinase A/oxoprolinase/acetone carboxylase beta subunit